jgi:hypothetical protein
MCAGCPGGRKVSPTTAYINHQGIKPALLKELRNRVGKRAKISTFGDRWMLTFPTGKNELFHDVEDLIHALASQGLADCAALQQALSGGESIQVIPPPESLHQT